MLDNNRTFGVEIEFIGSAHTVAAKVREMGVTCTPEGYNHTTRGYWKIITDASVRGENGQGLEIVSPILKGQAGLEELNKVCKALKAAGARINKTCGLHVHHGAMDFTTTTFKNLIKIYSRFESTIDTLVSESRRANNNTYCRSIKNSRYEAALYQNETWELIRTIGDRYHKLNLQSYLTHGTVEFRQHQGTIEFEKISNWIQLTQGIVERAKNRKVKEGKTNNWETFKYFLFLNPDANNRVSSYDSETKAMLKYFGKRRKELAA